MLQSVGRFVVCTSATLSFLFVTHWDINTRSLFLSVPSFQLLPSPLSDAQCVCARGKRGRERIGYHLQYKKNEKGVFPWGLIHLPQITLHFLIQPLTFWPSWEAVVSQWRPNRRVTPLIHPSSSPPPLLPGSPLTAKRCERLFQPFPFYNRWPHQPNQLLLILIDDK